MKHTVLALFSLLLVALLCIGGWYWMETNRVQSQTQAFADASAARTMVRVDFVVDVPDSTPDDQTVYVSGSHPDLGAWQAAGLPLQRNDAGKYQASVELLSGIQHEFKVTRGTWGTVERGADDTDIPNHAFKADEDTTITLAVAEWVDKGRTIPGRLTTTGDIRLHAKVASAHLDAPRDVVVYLPPGYNDATNAETRYRVLYVNDGQNLFNELTSYAGVEWNLDEAAQQLITDGTLAPMVIVGVYNTPLRDAEYSPSQRLGDYGTFLVTELKPMIDKVYRTQPGRETTAIAGAALGGLAALGVAVAQPETFGQVVALTPHLSVDGKPYAEVAATDLGKLADTKVYLDMGAGPSTNYPTQAPMEDAAAFRAALDSAGVTHTYADAPAGQHDEASWSARIKDVLLAAFAK